MAASSSLLQFCSSSSSSVDHSLPPCRASLSTASRSLPFHASPCPARFISLVSVAPRFPVKRSAVLALDPDFYKIPYVEGIPVGQRLKLYNLPPNASKEELIEWFQSIEITVQLLEFTDDPELNAQGINGFVEMSSKWECCMAVAQLDGRKFKGRCIRMDFVEKRPHEREIGGRRNRPSYSSNYNRDQSRSLVDNFEPRGRREAPPSYATTTESRPISQPSPAYGSVSEPPPSYASRPYSAPPSSNRIFVGNLPWTMDESGLDRLFGAHGSVQETRVMRDRETGRSRGFGFVVMSTAAEMDAAIAALNNHMVEGRPLKVNVAAAR